MVTVCTTALLSQNEKSEERRRMRKAEISINKKEFSWVPIRDNSYLSGLARHVDAANYDLLPRIFKRFTTRQKDITSNRLKSQLVTAIGQVRGENTALKWSISSVPFSKFQHFFAHCFRLNFCEIAKQNLSTYFMLVFTCPK